MSRVLYVDVKWPTPDTDAASQRALQLIRALVGMGFDVDVGVLFPSETGEGVIPMRELGGARALPDDGEEATLRHIAAHGASYDVAVVAWTRVADRLLPALRAANPVMRIVFDTVDVNHVREFRHARVSRNANILRRAMAMKQLELAAVAGADCTLAITEADAEVLRRESPGSRVEVVTLAVSPRERPVPGPESRSGVLYLGNYQAWHNVDAVTHLVRDILPEVHTLIPDVHVTLAGAGRHELIDELASEHVTVTGFLADVIPLFDRSTAFACPLRVGSGVKGKLLTSLALGLPIVGSSVAIEGMALEDGRHCIVADTPREVAAGIARLQTDHALWRRLSEGGRVLVQERFSSHVIKRQVEAVFAPLLERSGVEAHA